MAAKINDSCIVIIVSRPVIPHYFDEMSRSCLRTPAWVRKRWSDGDSSRSSEVVESISSLPTTMSLFWKASCQTGTNWSRSRETLINELVGPLLFQRISKLISSYICESWKDCFMFELCSRLQCYMFLYGCHCDTALCWRVCLSCGIAIFKMNGLFKS